MHTKSACLNSNNQYKVAYTIKWTAVELQYFFTSAVLCSCGIALDVGQPLGPTGSSVLPVHRNLVMDPRSDTRLPSAQIT